MTSEKREDWKSTWIRMPDSTSVIYSSTWSFLEGKKCICICLYRIIISGNISLFYDTKYFRFRASEISSSRNFIENYYNYGYAEKKEAYSH